MIATEAAPTLAPAAVPVNPSRAELAELAASLTARELDIMMHATAWESRWPLFRNHFCASESCDTWSTIQGLCTRGLMKVTREPSELSGGDHVFGVTATGIATLRGKGKRRAAAGEQSNGSEPGENDS